MCLCLHSGMVRVSFVNNVYSVFFVSYKPKPLGKAYIEAKSEKESISESSSLVPSH